MDVEQHRETEAEANIAAHSAIFSDLRNATPLARLNLTEIRAVLHRLAEGGYTIVKAGSVTDAKAKLAAL